MVTLREVMPREMMDGYFEKVEKFANVEVLEQFYTTESSFVSNESIKVASWPGVHKNVHFWVKLVTGHKVAWNENPSTGWSFPVINPSEEERAAASSRQTHGWMDAIRSR